MRLKESKRLEEYASKGDSTGTKKNEVRIKGVKV